MATAARMMYSLNTCVPPPFQYPIDTALTGCELVASLQLKSVHTSLTARTLGQVRIDCPVVGQSGRLVLDCDEP